MFLLILPNSVTGAESMIKDTQLQGARISAYLSHSQQSLAEG
jgi:hypothetical protein